MQDALARARDTKCTFDYVIYVAQGTYWPGENIGSSFMLPDGVSVYGGFPKGGSAFGLRNPRRYQTILSGRIGETQRNNTVVTMGNNTLLDGFTVIESSVLGQGIHGLGVDFTVANSTIEHNEGYGIYAENGNATVEWTHIRNNKVDGIYHSGASKSLYMTNCFVRQSGQFGVYCLNSTPIVINSVLSESDMALEGRAGIRMINPASRPYLQNVTVAHNKTRGVWRTGGALPEIHNSIVYHNGAEAIYGFTADITQLNLLSLQT